MNKITLHYENCPRTKDGMEIRASFPCKKCKGKGVVYLSEECPSCRGSGFIYLVDCIDCLGTGVSAKKGTCSTCKGKKVVPHQNTRPSNSVHHSHRHFLQTDVETSLCDILT